MRNRDWNGDGFTAARVSLASFLAQAGVSYRPEYGASPDFPRCLAAQTVHVILNYHSQLKLTQDSDGGTCLYVFQSHTG
jgi:hypothetical protein